MERTTPSYQTRSLWADDFGVVGMISRVCLRAVTSTGYPGPLAWVASMTAVEMLRVDPRLLTPCIDTLQ